MELKDYFKSVKRPCDYDNRSYYYKTLNQLFKDKKIEIFMTEPNMVCTSKSGFKFNLRISVAGWTKRGYLTNGITPLRILKVLAELISDEKVKESINVHFSFVEGCVCSRCSGIGFIKAFSHVCDGICFECYGLGRSIRVVDVAI